MMAKARTGGKLDAMIPAIALAICCMIATEAHQDSSVSGKGPRSVARLAVQFRHERSLHGGDKRLCLLNQISRIRDFDGISPVVGGNSHHSHLFRTLERTSEISIHQTRSYEIQPECCNQPTVRPGSFLRIDREQHRPRCVEHRVVGSAARTVTIVEVEKSPRRCAGA